MGCVVLGGAFIIGLLGIIASPSLRDRVTQPILRWGNLDQPAVWCMRSGVSPDLRISGCTTLIESGRVVGYAFYSRGDAYFNKGDYDRAIQDFDQAIRLKPDNSKIFSIRGLAYERKGDHDRAIQDYDQAIRLKPDDSNTLSIRGEAYLNKGDIDRAIQDYNQVIQLNPDDAEGFNGRCWVRAVAAKALEAALSDCNESLRIRPNSGPTLDSRGLVYFRMGQYDKAIADYDAALKEMPQSAGSLYVRGFAKRRKRDAAGGDADIAAANELDPKVSDQYARLSVTP